MTLGVNKFSFDGYLTLNGALCYDAHLEKIFGLPFEDGETEIIEKIFNAKKLRLKLSVNLRVTQIMKVNFKNKYTQDSILTYLQYKNIRVKKIYQVCACLDSNQKQIINDFLDYSVVTEWDDNAIDIFPINGGKENAIKKILEIYNLSKDEVMAFGDAENDIKMLETVGTSVAMGNASKQLKDIATYVTTDVDDDGIYNGLKHFGLID